MKRPQALRHDVAPVPSAERRSSSRPVSPLDRPAGALVESLLALAILAAPAWLMADRLVPFSLFGDDFAYAAESRDGPRLLASLFAPHNTHVVPLFRLGTFALTALSGRLATLPATLGLASYAGLLAAMVATGLLVVKETHSRGLGLVAMGLVGISTVTEPAVSWYSAGQALWAGTAIVLTRLAARSWAAHGGAWRFGLTAAGAIAAPALWSGGLVAGLVAASYLLAVGGRRPRRGAIALAGLTVALALLLVALAHRQITEPETIRQQSPEALGPRPVQAALSTAQATFEVLVGASLGLDLNSTPLQAVLLLAGLAVVWARSRGELRRPSPLETSGLVIIFASYLMVYTLRGNFPFEFLRSLTWYHAIPQLGAVLFVAGWWSESCAGKRAEHPTRRAVLAILGLLVALGLLQKERARRVLLDSVPPPLASEPRGLAWPEARRIRALFILGEKAERQELFLARLDEVERLGRANGLGRESLRRAFGRVPVPGVPEAQVEPDAAGLLALPEQGPDLGPGTLRARLAELLRPIPVRRPDWIKPGTPWPPPQSPGGR
ncbi:MAG: hypothetical protein P4L84_19735 [Isosphaeraceae bacterium]|nr:hypothetical protein [Isosphaeraceae bacterium]